MRIVCLVFVLTARVVLSHPLDMGALRGTVSDNRAAFRLEMAKGVLSLVSGVSDTDLVPPTLATKAQILLGATLWENPLQSSAGPCEWGEGKASVAGDKIRLETSAACPGAVAGWKLKLGFLKRAPRGYELLVKGTIGAVSKEHVMTASEEAAEFSGEPEHSWSEFILLGVEHIGATPSQWTGPNGFHLPDGIDHILFVLALVLGGGGFLGVLKTVTGFTLGHSITLALATLGIVRLPSRLVESAIALSIAFVAAEALFFKSQKSRWRIAAIFGLVHGLGFASALAELHLDRASLLKALVGFNVGVELGQAIIVSIALPTLFLLEKPSATRRFAIPAFGYLILFAGSYWFVRRAFAI